MIKSKLSMPAPHFILCMWLAEMDFRDGTPITWVSSVGALLSGGLADIFGLCTRSLLCTW